MKHSYTYQSHTKVHKQQVKQTERFRIKGYGRVLTEAELQENGKARMLEWAYQSGDLQVLFKDFPWTEKAYMYENTGNEDAALDVVFQKINSLLVKKHYPEVSRLLMLVPVAKTSINLLLGFLTITLAAKSKVPFRSRFFEQIEVYLEHNKLMEDHLLDGLS